MCLEGGCGTCVVALKGKHPLTGELKTWAANSVISLQLCTPKHKRIFNNVLNILVPNTVEHLCRTGNYNQ